MFAFARSFAVGAALILSLPLAGQAATMNFDLLPDEGAQLDTYSENGITATASGGVLAYESNPGFAHIDDSGTGLASTLDFTMSGLFDAVEFALVSFGYDFTDPPGPLSDNLFVTGYLNGSVVTTVGYILSDIVGASQTFQLGAAFAGIDQLRIELLYPVNSAACGAPCGHFDLDYVTLSATGPALVPLPASGLMLLTAGLLAGGLRLRRRR